MDTRSTTRARTGSNRGTVQTTNNTESGTEVNEPLSNAANAAENGADNTRANNDMDRENRDPGITDESIDDGSVQVHNDTRNTATNRANTASEEHAADGEQGENDVIAQAEARVWSDRLTTLETTIERQNERMEALMAMVSDTRSIPTRGRQAHHHQRTRTASNRCSRCRQPTHQRRHPRPNAAASANGEPSDGPALGHARCAVSRRSRRRRAPATRLCCRRSRTPC